MLRQDDGHQAEDLCLVDVSVTTAPVSLAATSVAASATAAALDILMALTKVPEVRLASTLASY